MISVRGMSSRERPSDSQIPEPFRIWEASKMGAAAWLAAGAIGYVLYIRPKMYPRIEYEKSRPFTPKEVEEWNQRQYKGAAQQAKQQ